MNMSMSLLIIRLMMQAGRLIDGIDFSAQPDNEVWYVTTDGQVYHNIEQMGWGAQAGLKVVSNTYKDGMGRAVYNMPIEQIGESFAQDMARIKVISLPRKVKSIGAYSLGYANINSADVVLLGKERISYNYGAGWGFRTLYVQKGLTENYAKMRDTPATGQPGIKEIKEINI